MDVAAAEETPAPGVRLRSQPARVMPSQRKVRARRKKRKELLVFQICLFGGLLLLVKGFSFLAERPGENQASGPGLLDGPRAAANMLYSAFAGRSVTSRYAQ